VGRARGACPSTPVESTARGALQSTARRTRPAASATFAGGEASRRSASTLEGRCSQGSLVRTTSTRWMPAGVNRTGWNSDKLSGRRGTIIFTSAAP